MALEWHSAHSIVESSPSDDENVENKTAEMDIRFILDALARLSPAATKLLQSLESRIAPYAKPTVANTLFSGL